MKRLLVGIIKIYQLIPGPWHNGCRHIPTCSNYALEALNKYGTIKGGYLSIKRLIRCNPWGTRGYDPVP
jgi:putative membrane protein insertion efficiency factor